jgi:hypothetical protein
MSIWEDRDTVGHGDDDDKEQTTGRYLDEKPEGRDGMADINKNKYDEDVNMIKSFDDGIVKNIRDKDSSKAKGHR